MTLLDVDNLWVKFPTRTGVFDAVRGVSFSLGKERLGIVGESGSGKSMTGRAILRLIRRPGQMAAGRLALEHVQGVSASRQATQEPDHLDRGASRKTDVRERR